MAEAADDGRLMSPEDALKLALADIGKEGALKNGKKIVILSLDDTEGQYDVSYVQAGMSSSEAMALCEVAKMRFLSSMGYVLGSNDVELR